MPSNSYNKDDIPRELQRLIDHTDRGIEQLYQLAGKNAKATEGASRSDRAGSSAHARAHRDAYYYDPAHVPVEAEDEERHAAARRAMPRRSPTSMPPSRREPDRPFERRRRENSFEAEDSDEGRDDLEGQDDSDDYRYNNEKEEGIYHDAYTYEGSRPGNEPREGRSRQLRWSGRTDAPPSHVHRGHSSSPSGDLRRAATSRRSTPASTPNRTLNYATGSPVSSPASLKKPRYTPQPDLPSPSSFLSTSQPNLSDLGPGIPPWRQRQHEQHARDVRGGSPYATSTGDGYALKRASAAVSQAGSPSSANTSTAYRTHLAAQQSTQKPTSYTGSSADAAAKRRQGLHRSLLFTDADDEAPATPDTSHVKSSNAAFQNQSLNAAEPRLRPRQSLNASSQESRNHNRDNVHNSSSASAGMLSRFGKRWGMVFEEMLTEVPPPTPPPAQPAPSTAATVPAQAAAPRAKRTSTQVPSTASSVQEQNGEGCDYRTERQEGQGSLSGEATSTSIHAAAEAIAARRHASPRASPNTSGVLVPTVNSTTPAAPSPPPPMPTQSTLHAFHSGAADARYIEQLRAELKAKEEAMLQLRMNHAREMAEVRQSCTMERATAAKHTADELATTYGIQQQLLQSSLQTERERVTEAEEKLRMTRREAAQRRLDLDDATHALETLQSKHAALSTAQQELVAQLAQWRTQAEKSAATAHQLEAQAKVWKAKEVDWQARERQLQQRVESAEERLSLQEASAQEVLAQVEAEFTQTSQSYQDLLAEATKRMAYLEKSHRKYKLLKESHSLLTAEHAQLVDTTKHRAQRHDEEVASLRAEVQELRQQLHQRDSVSQEATESYQETLNDYKRRLELQEASAAEHAKTIQQHLDTAKHTIELLRSQLEGAKHDLLEEQGRNQQQQMEAAQAELRAKENLAEQQRSAAAYKVRSEDVIAQQKRQLREKDAKMQALAANAAEPVQRLREQLDDERGRRARLEEQLKTYKRKAKEAEEHAAAEIRREQLRNALLTPAASASSMPQRLLRSATATPSSAHGTSTPRPIKTAAALAGAESARRTASASSTSTGVGGAGGRVSASYPHGGSAAVAVVMGTTAPGEGGGGGGGSGAQRQGRRQLRGSSPPHTPPSPPIVDGAHPPRREVLPAAMRTEKNARAPSGRVADADASVDDDLRHSHPAAATERRRRTHDGDGDRDARTGALDDRVAVVPSTSAVSPNATVQSLSGISRSSPYTSTLLGDAEVEGATVASAMAAGVSGTHTAHCDGGSAVSARSPYAESSAREVVHDEATDTLPWYAQRRKRGDRDRAEASDAPRVGVADSAPAAALDEGVAATQVYMDADTQAHEQRMQTFHSSALEVMRRFAGSRNEALARCADIVKQTAAERRRGVSPSPPLPNGQHAKRAAPAAAAASGASDSDSESV